MPKPTAVCAAVLALPLLLSGCASTPEGPAMNGKLLDDTSGAPLADALMLFRNGSTVEVDGRGRFELRGVAAGAHSILVLTRGCRSAELELTVPPASADIADVRVELPELETLPPPPPPKDSPGRLVLAAELAGMNVSTVGEALRRVAPEMVGRPVGLGGASSLRGRGVAGGGSRPAPVVVVDEVVLHGDDTAALDRIAARDVEWLEVLPGAVAGWEYGTGGSGGVIKVRTKRGSAPGASIPADQCPLPTDWDGTPPS